MEARYLVDLEWRICHAVNIYVFRNGRDGEQPVLVHIPPAKKKNMKTVMQVIQERVKYPVGYATHLFRMDGTRVRHPCELEMYCNYVVASNYEKHFKCAEYGRKRSPLIVLNRESKHVRVLKLQNESYQQWLLKKKAIGEERPQYVYPAFYTSDNFHAKDLPVSNMGNLNYCELNQCANEMHPHIKQKNQEFIVNTAQIQGINERVFESGSVVSLDPKPGKLKKLKFQRADIENSNILEVEEPEDLTSYSDEEIKAEEVEDHTEKKTHKNTNRHAEKGKPRYLKNQSLINGNSYELLDKRDPKARKKMFQLSLGRNVVPPPPPAKYRDGNLKRIPQIKSESSVSTLEELVPSGHKFPKLPEQKNSKTFNTYGRWKHESQKREVQRLLKEKNARKRSKPNNAVHQSQPRDNNNNANMGRQISKLVNANGSEGTITKTQYETTSCNTDNPDMKRQKESYFKLHKRRSTSLPSSSRKHVSASLFSRPNVLYMPSNVSSGQEQPCALGVPPGYVAVQWPPGQPQPTLQQVYQMGVLDKTQPYGAFVVDSGFLKSHYECIKPVLNINPEYNGNMNAHLHNYTIQNDHRDSFVSPPVLESPKITSVPIGGPELYCESSEDPSESCNDAEVDITYTDVEGPQNSERCQVSYCNWKKVTGTSLQSHEDVPEPPSCYQDRQRSILQDYQRPVMQDHQIPIIEDHQRTIIQEAQDYRTVIQDCPKFAIFKETPDIYYGDKISSHQRISRKSKECNPLLRPSRGHSLSPRLSYAVDSFVNTYQSNEFPQYQNHSSRSKQNTSKLTGQNVTEDPGGRIYVDPPTKRNVAIQMGRSPWLAQEAENKLGEASNMRFQRVPSPSTYNTEYWDSRYELVPACRNSDEYLQKVNSTPTVFRKTSNASTQINHRGSTSARFRGNLLDSSNNTDSHQATVQNPTYEGDSNKKNQVSKDTQASFNNQINKQREKTPPISLVTICSPAPVANESDRYSHADLGNIPPPIGFQEPSDRNTNDAKNEDSKNSTSRNNSSQLFSSKIKPKNNLNSNTRNRKTEKYSNTNNQNNFSRKKLKYCNR